MRAAGAASPPGQARALSEAGREGLEPLRAAFDSLGLEFPRLVNRYEEQAAADVLRIFGAESVARAWSDVAGGEWGDEWDRSHLSFSMLSKHNRLGNWQRERGAVGASAEYDEAKWGPIIPLRRLSS